jgi:hypothetical protein
MAHRSTQEEDVARTSQSAKRPAASAKAGKATRGVKAAQPAKVVKSSQGGKRGKTAVVVKDLGPKAAVAGGSIRRIVNKRGLV